MLEFIKTLLKIVKPLPMVKRLMVRKVRWSLRGYYKLRKDNQLRFPSELKNKLEATRVLPKDGRLSTHIFGSLMVDHDVIVRQFLLSKYFCAFSRFNFFLMSSIGSAKNRFYFPLPLNWRRVLTSVNIFAETRSNSLLWWLGILVHWVCGVGRIMLITINSLCALVSKSRWPSDYTFFAGVSEEKLPSQTNPLLERNILNWYAAWKGREARVNTLAYTAAKKYEIDTLGIKIVSIKSDLPNLPSFNALAKFFLWGCSSSILSLGLIVMGKWWDALLLSEAAKAAVVRFNPKERYFLNL